MKKAVGYMAVAVIAISTVAYSVGVVSSKTDSASAAGVETTTTVSTKVAVKATPVTSEKVFSSMIDDEISTQLAMNERK